MYMYMANVPATHSIVSQICCAMHAFLLHNYTYTICTCISQPLNESCVEIMAQQSRSQLTRDHAGPQMVNMHKSTMSSGLFSYSQNTVQCYGAPYYTTHRVSTCSDNLHVHVHVHAQHICTCIWTNHESTSHTCTCMQNTNVTNYYG